MKNISTGVLFIAVTLLVSKFRFLPEMGRY